MSDYLTTLPAELIHKIMDDVSTTDILLSICLVNKRLRAVSLAYPRFQPNFSDDNILINKNQFDCICTQLLPSISQIASLTLFDKYDQMTPVKNTLFFSRFNHADTTFSNLRSLTLTYITYDEWNLFKTRLPSCLKTLSINLVGIDSSECSLTVAAILNELLFFSSSLQRLSVKTNNYANDNIKIRPPNPTILSSIQYFHFEGIKIDLSSLFHVAPILNTLEIRFDGYDYISDNIHHQPMHLQRLRIELYHVTWAKMITLISSMPRLVYLTVLADDFSNTMADGFSWAKLLKDIKHFQFKLHFHWLSFNEQQINLNSFRTKFWLEEKKWFVTYDHNVNHGCSILYTNPSPIVDYASCDTIGIIVSEPTSDSRVYCWTNSYQYIKYALLHRHIHITDLKLSEIATTRSLTYADLFAYLDKTMMITCYVGSEWIVKSPYELPDFLRSLSCLRALCVSIPVLNYLVLHQWPNIHHLRIEYDFENNLQLSSSAEIDTLCHSFTHIERLDIHAASVTDLPQLLNKMKKKLTDIIIRQPRIDNNGQSITREWIERNTELENFHYACDDMNTVYLWF